MPNDMNFGVNLVPATDDTESLGTSSKKWKAHLSEINGSAVGAAAAKGVDTSITAGSTSTNVPTTGAVASFVEGKGYSTHGIPSGGTSGQVLAKSSGTDYAVGWTTPSGGMPTGGTSGQVLTKNSSTNYDASWATPSGLPSGSNDSFLYKQSNGTVQWITRASGAKYVYPGWDNTGGFAAQSIELKDAIAGAPYIDIDANDNVYLRESSSEFPQTAEEAFGNGKPVVVTDEYRDADNVRYWKLINHYYYSDENTSGGVYQLLEINNGLPRILTFISDDNDTDPTHEYPGAPYLVTDKGCSNVETWTFTLSDNSTVTKKILVGTNDPKTVYPEE